MATVAVRDADGVTRTAALVPNTGEANPAVDSMPVVQPTTASAYRVEPLGRPTEPRQLTISGTSDQVALTPTCTRITMYARGCAARYTINGSTPNADTSHLLPDGFDRDIRVLPGTTLRVIRPTFEGTKTGTFEISEME